MQIQIDTVKKTIKVLEEVNLKDLFEKLKELLPDDEWKKFSVLIDDGHPKWYYPPIYNPWTDNTVTVPNILPTVSYNDELWDTQLVEKEVHKLREGILNLNI